MRMTRSLGLGFDLACAALALLVAGGCPSDGESTYYGPAPDNGPLVFDDDHGEPDPPEDPPRIQIDVEACRGDLIWAKVRENVEIAYDYEAGLVQLRSDGSRIGGLATALLEERDEWREWFEWVEHPETSSLPEGYVHLETGAYAWETSGPELAQLEVRLYDLDALVTADVFSLSSYLLEPQVSRSGESGLSITHAGPGPLVELLGLGLQPPSPIVVASVDELGLGKALGKLRVEASMRSSHTVSTSTIEYHVSTERMEVEELVAGAPLELVGVRLSGWRDDLEQELVVQHLALSYVHDALGGVLDGTTRGEVDGGLFDFRADYDYALATEPTIVITCSD
jgi:hypothetical protein